MARAGATGGGRSYRARVPYRWYSGLALIVILGLFLIVYSRHELLNPTTTPSVAPTTSDHWVAGLVFDLCGKNQQTLPAQKNTSGLGLYTTGNGVLIIAPKTSADAGANATVGRFAEKYSGFTLTSDSVGITGKHIYKDGAKCPSGTPDAGKVGDLEAKIYATASANSPTTQTGDMRAIRFTQSTQLVTIAFVPNGASVARPASGIVEAVLNAVSTSTSTTTTPATTTPTTTATTTKGATTTTTKGATTTTTKGATTTTTTSASTTTSTTG